MLSPKALFGLALRRQRLIRGRGRLAPNRDLADGQRRATWPRPLQAPVPVSSTSYFDVLIVIRFFKILLISRLQLQLTILRSKIHPGQLL
jgi:hypothetical protein